MLNVAAPPFSMLHAYRLKEAPPHAVRKVGNLLPSSGGGSAILLVRKAFSCLQQLLHYFVIVRSFLEPGVGSGKVNRRDIGIPFFEVGQCNRDTLVMREPGVVDHREIIKT